MSDDSGTLFIKPCTDSEISFYEVATAEHPALASLMPTYHGKLDLLGKVDLDGDNASTETALASATASMIAKQQPTPKPSMQRQTTTQAPQPQLLNDVSANSRNAATSPRKAHFGKPLDTPLCIVLEDVATHFRHPNILDLKLGAQLWDHDAPPEKRARLDKVASQTTSKSLGFRISGMRVWHGHGGDDGRAKPEVPDGKGDENAESDPSESSLASPRINIDSTAASDIPDSTVPHSSSIELLTATSESVKAAVETIKTTTAIHEPDSGYTFYNKMYGRTFTAETVKAGFRVFLCPEIPTRTHSSSANADNQTDKNNAEPFIARTAKTTQSSKFSAPLLRARTLTQRILADIRRMIHILEHEETRMFSSSILIMYEGNSEMLEKTLQVTSPLPAQENDNNNNNSIINNSNNQHDAGNANDQAKDSGITPNKPNETKNTTERESGVAPPEPKFDSASPSSSTSSSPSSPSNPDSAAAFVPKSHTVRLIDFAHSSWAPGQGPDQHMLHGMRNVAAVLEGLMAEFEEEIGFGIEPGCKNK